MRFLAFLLCLLALPAAAGELYAPVKTQGLQFGTSATKVTDDFGANIEGVRVSCVTACYVAFGVSSTLTVTAATGILIQAGIPQDFRISGGNIAVIQVSATGRFSVTELSK